MSKIQRALGFIEGVCAGLKDKEAELIEGAVNEIDCELVTKVEEVHNPISLVGITFEEDDWLSSTEIEELTERLKRHFTDHQNGKTQNFEMVFRDCLLAALSITQLGEMLKDKECAACMEQP